ncbi:hypothetical protein KC333_g6796 [Hortaea werneckii]|nr:hypothetical protein KC333_g6796 [Hortaea werneckii]KAI7311468.1 hypothetical protein KC326_g6291 [Hortaea werneckii]
MRGLISTAATLLALGASAVAIPTYTVNNHCLETKWYYLANSTGTFGPYNITSGVQIIRNIVGQGNAFHVVLNETVDIWSATPKATLATSVGGDGQLYWNLNNFTGDPMYNSAGGKQAIGVVTNGLGCDVASQTGYNDRVNVCANTYNQAQLIMSFC